MRQTTSLADARNATRFVAITLLPEPSRATSASSRRPLRSISAGLMVTVALGLAFVVLRSGPAQPLPERHRAETHVSSPHGEVPSGRAKHNPAHRPTRSPPLRDRRNRIARADKRPGRRRVAPRTARASASPAPSPPTSTPRAVATPTPGMQTEFF